MKPAEREAGTLRAELTAARAEARELRRERDGLRRRLDDERRLVAGEARRIAASHAWRLGHTTTRLLRAAALRPARGREGAIEQLAERLEARLEPVRLPSAPGVPPAPRPVPISRDHLDRLAAAPPITVVVPIHDAPAHVRRCLDALARNTGHARIVLVDDGSREARIGELLQEHPIVARATVIRNRHNLGFTQSVNLGIDHGEGDVVLLNSDTEVPPRWLEGLRLVAYGRARVATVTPLSTNAGIFSAPEPRVANRPPEGMDCDAVGRLVSHHSERLAPEAPTGSAYCMYVRRQALEQVGRFDAVAFPDGYGVENAFCRRATELGWVHLLDDATFVLHAGGVSAGGDRDRLVRRAGRRLRRRHPQREQEAARFLTREEPERARANVARAFRASQASAKPRALAVGAPEASTGDSGWDTLALAIEDGGLTLRSPQGEVLEELTHAAPEQVASLLVSYGVERVFAGTDVPALKSATMALSVPVSSSLEEPSRGSSAESTQAP